ncbi:hypothetical protein L1987_34804 [Smallanthus sonchifolius]|uniref:Uncharacterized protein n=1 Tax=Smallanthus sonchifolius TaxID=185202 RepID=A0ACB9HWJ1_9ASTR|nr:hypothetical protein L1987_34804 [Smallanthus sonchifolius]
MALLFKDPNKISAYRDRRFPGTQEEYENALQTSTTVYIGNMSFYTTEEQLYELFSRAGEIKKIVMGLDKNTKTPCGFCFVMYYSREDTEDAVKYISGTILDDRPIRVDFDWGFQDGRQWGRGRSGGQVRDEYRTDYDPDILLCGYGKLVQQELEEQRQVVDYGVGSLGSFQPSHMSHNCEFMTCLFNDLNSSSLCTFADFLVLQMEDMEEEEEVVVVMVMGGPTDMVEEEKNPRFREHGDSDDEEDDRKRQK